VGGHLYDAERRLLEQDYFRVALPRSVAPGEGLELECRFAAPQRSGRYVVEIDLVDEGIAWFGSRGSSPLSLELSVGGGGGSAS
jgi:hypothetical protein